MREYNPQQVPLGSDRPAHAHYFYGHLMVTSGHFHLVEFFAYPVNGSSSDDHFHTFQGHTYLTSGHFHRILGRTGPPIELPDGSHIHPIDQETDDEPFDFQGNSYITITSIPRHVHRYKGNTGKGIGYEPSGW